MLEEAAARMGMVLVGGTKEQEAVEEITHQEQGMEDMVEQELETALEEIHTAHYCIRQN